MKSGMLAAESAFAAIQAERSSDVLDDYEANLRSSWIATELQLVKTAEPLLSKFGNSIGTVLAGTAMWTRPPKIRPEVHRVGEGCVRGCRFGGAQAHEKKK